MLIDELKDIVGTKAWTTDKNELEAHVTEWRGAVRGKAAIMVSQASTEEVSNVVRACAAAGDYDRRRRCRRVIGAVYRYR